MKKNEIETILSMCLEKEEYEYSIPSNEDWKKLEKKLTLCFQRHSKLSLILCQYFLFLEIYIMY